MRIDIIDEWNDLAKTLAEFDCHIWQLQYDINSPEGFHARFVGDNGSEFEVETHSEDVYKAILKFISPSTGWYYSRHLGE